MTKILAVLSIVGLLAIVWNWCENVLLLFIGGNSSMNINDVSINIRDERFYIKMKTDLYMAMGLQVY